MEYNSIHRFRLDQRWDADMFIESLFAKGFSYRGYDKGGGAIYEKDAQRILVRVG